MTSRGARWGLVAATVGILVFIYFPLAVVIAYAFNSSGTTSWPPAGFSLRWVELALANTGLHDAFVTSIVIAASRPLNLCPLSLDTVAYQDPGGLTIRYRIKNR